MARPPLEVADVVRAHRADYESSHGGILPGHERRVLDDIECCRTAALGGHVLRCNECGHEEIAYNSCRNRHCPKCQAAARTDWLADRERELLPVEYFHVVFTLPKEIAPLAFQNKRLVYGMLFQAASETLREVAASEKHLGAEIGVLAVLHTWGQNLQHHPHVHCVVPGGGLAPDGAKWVPCRSGFFLPVRVLSTLFRGKFLDRLKRAFVSDDLVLHGGLAKLDNDAVFRAWLSPLYEKDWVVYSKRPFGSPARVLKYLARYTHRTAIANSRLVALRDGNVSFLWKDYAHGCRRRVMTLTAVEFLRRFLRHVLPKGFVRIRHYGLFANRHRYEKLAVCRQLIEAGSSPSDAVDAAGKPPPASSPSNDPGPRCPCCDDGIMIRVLDFEPGQPIAACRDPTAEAPR